MRGSAAFRKAPLAPDSRCANRRLEIDRGSGSRRIRGPSSSVRRATKGSTRPAWSRRPPRGQQGHGDAHGRDRREIVGSVGRIGRCATRVGSRQHCKTVAHFLMCFEEALGRSRTLALEEAILRASVLPTRPPTRTPNSAGCTPPQPQIRVPGDKTGTIGQRNEADQLPDARRSGRPLLFQLTFSSLLSSSSVTFRYRCVC